VSANAGNSWYVDSVESMESFYLDEFIKHVEASLDFNGDFKRYIAGNSAGGYGTLRFTLLQPGSFESAILLSPAAYEPLPPVVSSSRKVEAFANDGKFNDSIWQSYSYTHRIDSFLQKKEKPKFYLSVGDDDNYNIVPVVTKLQQLFLKNNVPNELRVMDGGHDWTFWKKSFVNFLTEICIEEKIIP
jgi:S-formylglutathione hydrolase FrmB